MSLSQNLIQNALKDAISYEAYSALMQQLEDQGNSTGFEQSEYLSNYTMLNNKRMQRLNKTLSISEDIKKRFVLDTRSFYFLILSESWCGDAAQSIPMWAKVADLKADWQLLIVSRDAHEGLMELFLTNGSKSIPKVLVLDGVSQELITHWGPRPSVASKMATVFMEVHGSLTAEFKTDLQKWYNKDKGQTTLKDILDLLEL